METVTKVQYRVTPITRYQITRYVEDGPTGGVEQRGEYNNSEVAYEVAYALCRAEHDRLGFPPGDERMVYPEPVYSGHATRSGAVMIPKDTRGWFNIDEYDYSGERMSCEVDDVALVQPIGFVWHQKPRYRVKALSKPISGCNSSD
jgi:hypothetical protein